jgi:hypothetical protein
MSHPDQHRDLWKELDPSTNEHAKIYLSALQATRSESSTRAMRSFYGVLVLVATHALLATEQLSELSVLSFKLNDAAIVRLAIPLLASYLYYQATAQLIFATLINHMLNGYFATHLPRVYDADLEMLTAEPNILNIEEVLATSTWWGRSVASAFGKVVISFLLIAPGVYIAVLGVLLTLKPTWSWLYGAELLSAVLSFAMLIRNGTLVAAISNRATTSP